MLLALMLAPGTVRISRMTLCVCSFNTATHPGMCAKLPGSCAITQSFEYVWPLSKNELGLPMFSPDFARDPALHRPGECDGGAERVVTSG